MADGIRTTKLLSVCLLITWLLLGTWQICPAQQQYPGGAAASQPSGQLQLFPFQGVVTGDSVYIRSGPDTNYYPIAKLNTGAKVAVVDQEYGWYKITPPQGSFSWVSKRYVESTGSKAGRITGSRVNIRAGSPLSSRNFAVQMQAEKGTEVQIVGQQGQWYKISPPEGAYLWISARYVKGIGVVAKPEMAQKPVKTATSQPARLATTRPTVVVTSQPVFGLEAIDYGQFGQFAQQLARLDKRFKQQLGRPLAQQSWDDLLEKYRQIGQQKGPAMALAYTRQRAIMIDYQLRIQGGLRDIQELGREFEQSIQLLSEQRAEIQLEQVTVPQLFVAKGLLNTSMVFVSPSGPQRFRLVKPDGSRRTVAYIQVGADSGISLSQFLGKYVGVRGKLRYDTQLRVDIIVVDYIKQLTMPKPAPKADQAPATRPTSAPAGK